MEINQNQKEWNDRSKELTFLEKEKLPLNLKDIRVSMTAGDLVIENCLEDEEPSYTVTTVIRGANNEEDARKECGSTEESFQIDVTDSSFKLKEKNSGSGDVSFGNGNIFVGSGNVVINGRVITGNSGSRISVDKKAVLRIRPEQAEKFDIHNTSGDIDIADIKGKGRIRTSSGDIEVQTVDGQLSMRTSSGDIVIESITGESIITTSSGDVDVDFVYGESSITTSSGAVSIKDLELNGNSIVRTSSGRISIGIVNSDLMVQARSNSGRFKNPSNFIMDEDSSGRMGCDIEGHFGEITDNSLELDISSSSGSITLRNSDRDVSERVTTEVSVLEGYLCPFCDVENETFGRCVACGGKVPSTSKS